MPLAWSPKKIACFHQLQLLARFVQARVPTRPSCIRCLPVGTAAARPSAAVVVNAATGGPVGRINRAVLLNLMLEGGKEIRLPH